MTSSNNTPLRIGTRGSELALWQAEHVATAIRALPAAPPVVLEVIRTRGDRIIDVPLSRVAGKDFFTKEIEDALLDGRIDLAVHSLKDLATRVPDGLTIGAVLEREDPRDVLIARTDTDLDGLAPGSRVGTSSLRRRALLARLRTDLELAELRGNVPTRFARLDAGDFDAVVLAAAGVLRLGLAERISAFLPVDRLMPAVSQGAMAIQIRSDDPRVIPWISPLEHRPTRAAVSAERALLGRLEGGCQVPVGALAKVSGERLRLEAVVCSIDGSRSVSGRREGPAEKASAIGTELAEQLHSEGADDILAQVRAALGPGARSES
jgi:hydroxymethylbilane synthase